MKGRRLWLGMLFAVAASIGAMTVYGMRHRFLHWMGSRLLAKSHPPSPPWDAIIVLSGRPFERSLRAAELYYDYPARIIALGGAHNDDLLAIGYSPSQECAFTAAALRSLCVPDSAIHSECTGTSTYEEVQHIRLLCRREGWRRVVIVSSPFHGRRIERLMMRWVGRDSVEWGIAAARPLQYDPDVWWLYEAGILTVFEEGVKSLYYAWKGYF